MPLTLASRPWRANSLPRRGLLASVLSGMEPLAFWRGLSKVIELLSSGASRLKRAINVAAISAALLPASLPGIMGRQRQLRGALVKHQDRLGAPAKHEVGLPIAELPATHDRLGSLVDRAAILNRALGFAAFAPAAPRLAARQQLPELLQLLPGMINKAIDRRPSRRGMG